ncbi:Piso0_000813 [Millerozyma farinosa CBS 7064]|uniref:Piso0_000813 protein n=1 Tax=Pichia sorbitophila (strain ATCC MYA-4447 / BCRC 22081 / CBS 7064 / NBRC 10061 / NRRL Y-12695) TaxID=559304 RepID=G8YQ49_PICSO|nr:Piso0_000813 [Millerozyma farinosa CBS 7064]
MSPRKNLAFNVSKATPTTSTSNENTISSPPTSSEGSNSGGPNNNGDKSPFLHNILSLSPTSQYNIQGLGTNSVVTASLVNVEDNTSNSKTNANKSHSQHDNADLIGLFDKFDLNQGKNDNEEASDEKSDEKDHDEDARENDEKQSYDSLSVQHESSAGTRNENPSALNQEHVSATAKHGEAGKAGDADNDSVSRDSSSKSLHEISEKVSEVSHEQNLQFITGSEYEQRISAEEYKDNSSHGSSDDEQGTKELRKNVTAPYETKTKDVSGVRSYGEELKAAVANSKQEKSDHVSERHENTQNVGRSRKHQPTINPKERYQQSHKPFDFQIFLSHLRKKSADPIVRYVRSFLISFNKQSHTFTSVQKVKIINDFKTFMNEKFTLYEPFASMDDVDLENSREGLEKLIMNRLYEHCFSPGAAKQFVGDIPDEIKDDLRKDSEFYLKLEQFSWVNGAHLDVNISDINRSNGNFNFIDYAIKELNKINNYRAPRDKIICILNSCKIIFNFLKLNNQETNADAFMPLLILVTMKAKIPHLISNMNYIENYRGEEWLSHGETSYYLSSLQGAIGFISNLGFDDLTIDRSEYDAHIEAWEAHQKQKNETLEAERQERGRIGRNENFNDEQESSSHANQGLSPSNVLLTSAGMVSQSISSFLSPLSSNDPSPVRASNDTSEGAQGNRPHSSEDQDDTQQVKRKMKETFAQLEEIFPVLDKAVLKDVVIINKGDLDQSLDACLQLVNEV